MDITNHSAGVLHQKDTKQSISKTPKVLLVGHNEYDNRHIKRMLTPRYEVVISTNLSEAEALLRIADYQLVISEYAPTGVNGNLLLKQIKAVSDLPVFILSAFQSENEIISLYDNGADEVMRIPFLEYEFVSRVHHLLAN